MVSKSLDEWRRDISEKRRKRMSKRYYIPMKRFNSKPPENVYFLHLFFRFSLNFPNVKISNCFTVSITGRRMFASTLGRARLFTPMNSSSAKIHESVARRLRQPIHGFGCVAHKRIYSQWLQRHMMPSVFFWSYPRKKCHGNPTNPSGETVSTRTAWNRRLTSSENTARADPTPAVEANLFFQDVQYWKLKLKLKTIITT